MKKLPFELVQEKAIKPQRLLLESTMDEIPVGIEDIISKYEKLGINPEMIVKAKEKVIKIQSKNQDKKKEQGFNEFLKHFISEMFPFNVIELKVLHEICKTYNIRIAPINMFNKQIPDNAFEDIEVYKEKIENYIGQIPKALTPMEFMDISDSINHYSATFQVQCYHSAYVTDIVVNTTKFIKNAAFIAAPLGHLRYDKKRIYMTKTELVRCIPMKREKFDFSLNTKEFIENMSKVAIDPIIFIPFKLNDKLYANIVTGWGEEFDDERLRNFI